MSVRKFLIVVDDSPEFAAALSYACRRAKSTGGLVAMLRVLQQPEFEHWSGVRDEIERELAAEDLKKSMQDLKRDIDVRGDLQEMARNVESASHETVVAPPAEATPPDPPRS